MQQIFCFYIFTQSGIIMKMALFFLLNFVFVAQIESGQAHPQSMKRKSKKVDASPCKDDEVMMRGKVGPISWIAKPINGYYPYDLWLLSLEHGSKGTAADLKNEAKILAEYTPLNVLKKDAILREKCLEIIPKRGDWHITAATRSFYDLVQNRLQREF